MLQDLGCKDMCIIPAKIDELAVGHEYRDINNGAADKFEKLVLTIAEAKARSILGIVDNQKLPSAQFKSFHYQDDNSCSEQKVCVPTSGIILTGDQVVICNNQIYEKPTDAAEAKRFYQSYSEGSCSTVGSVMLTDIETRCSVSAVDVTTLHFNKIPESVIDGIVNNSPPRDENEVIMYCCGALMSEHSILSTYISHIDGDIDAVLGLRKATVLDLLDRLDFLIYKKS
jgi:predicted house-cleaning NTP pyrophosphatase (Maf/HAM1 superfamily)